MPTSSIISIDTRINRTISIIGIILFAIFVAWFPRVVLQVPFPSDPVWYSLYDSIWMISTMVIIPYVYAYTRIGLTPADLGITTTNLPVNLILGMALYSVALLAFLHCSSDPLINNHLVKHVTTNDAAILTISMGTIAIATDLATRGFLLLALARYSNILFAVIMQNLLWLAGHITEINLLSGCLGTYTAIGLTLFLGLAGDAIVLKTRSVVGLAIAHFMLNITLVLYIRSL